MSTAQSITRLFGLGLTPGKLRGLQRISNSNGTLTMVATDQNSSMIKMMKDAMKREPSYAEIADAKVMLSRALSPHCSGLLVDGKWAGSVDLGTHGGSIAGIGDFNGGGTSDVLWHI